MTAAEPGVREASSVSSLTVTVAVPAPVDEDREQHAGDERR